MSSQPFKELIKDVDIQLNLNESHVVEIEVKCKGDENYQRAIDKTYLQQHSQFLNLIEEPEQLLDLIKNHSQKIVFHGGQLKFTLVGYNNKQKELSILLFKKPGWKEMKKQIDQQKQNIEKLTQKNTAQQGLIKAIQQRLSSIQGKISPISRQIQQLQAKDKNLNSQIQELKKKDQHFAFAEKLKELNQYVTDLQAQFKQTTQTKQNDFSGKITGLEQALNESIKSKNQELKQQLLEKINKINQLQTDLSQFNTKLGEKDKQIEQKDKQIEQKIENISNTLLKIKQENQHIQSYQNQIQQLKKKDQEFSQNLKQDFSNFKAQFELFSKAESNKNSQFERKITQLSQIDQKINSQYSGLVKKEQLAQRIKQANETILSTFNQNFNTTITQLQQKLIQSISCKNQLSDLKKNWQNFLQENQPYKIQYIDFLGQQADQLQQKIKKLKDQFKKKTAKNIDIDGAINTANQQKNKIKAFLGKLKSFDKKNNKIMTNYQKNNNKIKQLQQYLKSWKDNQSKLGNHNLNENSYCLTQQRIDLKILHIKKIHTKDIACNFVNKYQMKIGQEKKENVKYTIKVRKVLPASQSYIWIAFSTDEAFSKEFYQAKQRTGFVGKFTQFFMGKLPHYQTKGRYGHIFKLQKNANELFQCQVDLKIGKIKLTKDQKPEIIQKIKPQDWNKVLYLEIATIIQIELDLQLAN